MKYKFYSDSVAWWIADGFDFSTEETVAATLKKFEQEIKKAVSDARPPKTYRDQLHVPIQLRPMEYVSIHYRARKKYGVWIWGEANAREWDRKLLETIGETK